MSLNRRQALVGLGAVSMAASVSAPAFAKQTGPHIVIIGGGFGGVAAARTLARLALPVRITLIEAEPGYVACPFSNLVIGADRAPEAQKFSYDRVKLHGIEIIHARAEDVDSAQKTVLLSNGQSLSYDRLVLSPGVDMRWGSPEGCDEAASARMPHAWKAGAQTELLRRQLDTLEDGGLVVMSVPAAPFRCPPGPYERASLIAHYLKTRKPKSRLLVLDSKDSFSKMPLFQEAWAKHYPDHLEWRAASEDGRVVRIDAATKTLFTDFDTIKADVANVIPAQKAGQIAERAGVTDLTGWCPVDPLTFESKLHSGVYVIGDATIAAPMPKSAFSANLQGKLCAIAISRSMTGDEPPGPTTLINTCYSFITPDEAISIVGVYSNADGAFTGIQGAGGLSAMNAPASERQREALQARDWFAAITKGTFG